MKTEEFEELLLKITNAISGLNDRVTALEARSWRTWPAPGEEFTAWVDQWLIPTFQMGSLLEGWQKQPAVTSELAALFGGYQEMTGPRATGWDALAWHQHRLNVEQNIKEFLGRTRNHLNTSAWGNS